MIRILHFVNSLTSSGGLCNFIMNYDRRIDREKIQFDFVYFREVEKDFKEEITSLGGRFFKWESPRLFFNYKKQAEEFFDNHRGEYSMIHCHVLFATACFGKVARKHGIKVISHSHSTVYGNGFIRKIRNRYFVRRANKLCDVRLACSKKAGEFMFGGNSFFVIPNAVDVSKYVFNTAAREKVRSEFKIEGELLIGHVGGFEKVKNQGFLVDIFAKIMEKDPSAKLILVGGRGYNDTTDEVKNKVKEMGLSDSVIFTGPRTDVSDILSAIDVFVFPSLFEGFGLALLEAEISGAKCFASTEVPEEVNCTGEVKYLPLVKGSDFWAEEILLLKVKNRRQDRDAFWGYDVNCKSTELENIYINTSESMK